LFTVPYSVLILKDKQKAQQSVELLHSVCYIFNKKSTHSKVDASRTGLNVLTDTAYPVGRQDRHFYFRLFLLLRKASNAITKLPKAISRANIPMKIEMISKAVICATSLLMYSGKPVIKCREISTLSWALSYGFRHVNNISFSLLQFNNTI